MLAVSKKYVDRMTPLFYHPEQQKLIDDTFTFNRLYNVVHPGRRSGKTEICGKRRFIARAVQGVDAHNPRYFVAAPTRDQAWRLYWNDLKLMTLPFQDQLRPPSESRLIIYLWHDIEIHVVGMDKPERIEGSHWDGGILDEIANMKENTWEEHVEPALNTPGRPPGWCDFIGVPEGRNHFYDLYRFAKEQLTDKGEHSRWGVAHWFSADILPKWRVKAARERLDPLTFQQEYEGSFISFAGRAYYNFQDHIHCAKLQYNRRRPITFCFDFNVDPGVAVVAQEQNWVDPKTNIPEPDTECTGIIGEVHIPRNSNTVAVCKKLVQDWEDHASDIYVYGDATGGSRHSSQVDGTDWDLVEKVLYKGFENQIHFNVGSQNPRERGRINAVNSRLLSVSNRVGLQVDPKRAPQTVKDFEGTPLLEGGSGEIDKKKAKKLSHLTDALGYYIADEYPVNPIEDEVLLTGT